MSDFMTATECQIRTHRANITTQTRVAMEIMFFEHATLKPLIDDLSAKRNEILENPYKPELEYND